LSYTISRASLSKQLPKSFEETTREAAKLAAVFFKLNQQQMREKY
jgi:hypothetical protein